MAACTHGLTPDELGGSAPASNSLMHGPFGVTSQEKLRAPQYASTESALHESLEEWVAGSGSSDPLQPAADRVILMQRMASMQSLLRGVPAAGPAAAGVVSLKHLSRSVAQDALRGVLALTQASQTRESLQTMLHPSPSIWLPSSHSSPASMM